MPRIDDELSPAQKAFDRRKRFWRFIRTCGVCVGFYLLSTGPICKLVDRGRLPDTAHRVYRPVVWLAEQSWGQWAKESCRWYIADVWSAQPPAGLK